MPDSKRKSHHNKSQKVVKDWFLTERGKLQQGIFVANDKVILEAFLRRYLEDFGKRSLRIVTYESYEAIIEKHIIPELGSVRLVSFAG